MLCRYLSSRVYNIRKMCDIPKALKNVRENIIESHLQYCKALGVSCESKRTPLLVAVSKTKPNQVIIDAYQCGQRHFGENYVQELIQKANHFNAAGYEDMKWHFVGHLQKNKVNNLLNAPNIHVIETVDSIKLADALNKCWQKKEKDFRLKVFAQINTSGEVNKSGVEPSECMSLVEHIYSKCDYLQLEGLMTIGSFSHDYSKGPNPDFQCLIKCREEVCEKLTLNIEDLQLSMGMSNDYKQAILAGSTNIRVGSTIFGARNKPQVNDVTSNHNEENEIKLQELKVS